MYYVFDQCYSGGQAPPIFSIGGEGHDPLDPLVPTPMSTQASSIRSGFFSSIEAWTKYLITFGTRFLEDVSPLVRIKHICLKHGNKVIVSADGIYCSQRAQCKFTSQCSLKWWSHTGVFVWLNTRTAIHSVVKVDIVCITIHQTLQVPLILEGGDTTVLERGIELRLHGCAMEFEPAMHKWKRSQSATCGTRPLMMLMVLSQVSWWCLNQTIIFSCDSIRTKSCKLAN